MEQEAIDRLETQFVDAFGLKETIGALVDICYAKAEHLRTHWQDEYLAKNWEQKARQLDTYSI